MIGNDKFYSIISSTFALQINVIIETKKILLDCDQSNDSSRTSFSFVFF